MANIIRESVTVGSAGPGRLRIQHTQVHDDGIDMGGQLVLDQSAAPWLADQVARACDAWDFAEIEMTLGPDHFTVYLGGSDMQPFIHVHNQRAPDAPDGRTYTIAMTLDTARSLAAQLVAG